MATALLEHDVGEGEVFSHVNCPPETGLPPLVDGVYGWEVDPASGGILKERGGEGRRGREREGSSGLNHYQERVQNYRLGSVIAGIWGWSWVRGSYLFPWKKSHPERYI